MSTLKTTNLQHASAASPAIVLAADGTATAQLSSINGGPIAGARNRIINGAMEVSQRGTSTASTGYLLDRWSATNISAQSQSTDAPAGFINSLEFTSSSATYPYIEQRIERINSQDLASKTVTLSFWAKNVSGSSSLYFEIFRANSNDNFSAMTLEANPFVNASPSASWTYYSSSFTLSANATTGIAVRIVRSNASAASTRITGLQLEAGSVATPFERRSYGQELMLASRYFQTYTAGGQEWIYNEANGSTNKWWQSYIMQPMRSTPTASLEGTWTGGSVGGIGTISAVAAESITASRVSWRVSFTASGGSGNLVYHTDSFSGKRVLYSSEL